MARHEELINQVKELIRNNRTGKALELLAKEQLSSLDKDLIILNSQYSKIKDDQRLGVIDEDLAQRRLNKINVHLLELSEKIGKSSVEKISTNLLKQEEKFNKWWIIAPALVMLIITGVFIVKSIEPEKNEIDPINNIFDKNTPIDTLKDSIPIIENPLSPPPPKIHFGQIRPTDNTNFGITVYYGRDKNDSQIRLHKHPDDWKMLPSGAIVLSDNESLGLTVSNDDIKNTPDIILNEKYDYWKILGDGKIVLKKNHDYGLTIRGNIFENDQKIILYHKDGSHNWNFKATN